MSSGRAPDLAGLAVPLARAPDCYLCIIKRAGGSAGASVPMVLVGYHACRGEGRSRCSCGASGLQARYDVWGPVRVWLRHVAGMGSALPWLGVIVRVLSTGMTGTGVAGNTAVVDVLKVGQRTWRVPIVSGLSLVGCL